MYICDDCICMIALPVSSSAQAELNPYNTLTTPFYGPHAKPQLLFNLKGDLAETPPYQSPYHPSYHYKQHFGQFVQKYKSTVINQPCDEIEITRWSISVVNINMSGFYAPVLNILSFRNLRSTRLNFVVTNVLFAGLEKPLEELRLKHIRRLNSGKIKDSGIKSSLAYYMRKESASMKNNAIVSPFVCLDIKGSVLVNNQNKPLKLVPIGKLQEYSLFQRPVNQKYLGRLENFALHKYLPEKHSEPEESSSS